MARTAPGILARLTIAEKIALLHQHQAAIPRLGLEPFTTGAEALHGVSWLGTATTFPQPPGLAASWSPELLTAVGDVVATELRAKHAADPSVSLNVWAPVVNTLRHPLWGRGEEGYSEDPELTAELATAYCRGLRGKHPEVWKTVPTLKHYLAYGNELDRAVTSSHLPPQALRETELPAFTGPLNAGVVGAVMPSYNLVNGRPNHVAVELLAELRSWSRGSIAVVSDAQAPSNLVDGERYFPDHVQASAAAIRAGLDSFTDNDNRSEITIERVTKALADGLLVEADIDAAVLRLLELRERTGEFGDTDPYDIGPDAIDLPAHRELARKASGSGVVLLKNDGVFPLSEPSSIAVVGPFADHVVTDWYSGTPPYTVSIADALRERYPEASVQVADGADVVALRTGEHYLAVSPEGDVLTASEVTSASIATQFSLTEWGHNIVTLRSRATGSLVTGANWIIAADSPRVGGWICQETFLRVPKGEGVALQHVGTGRWLRVQLGSRLLVHEQDPALATVFTIDVLSSGSAAVAAASAGADVTLVALGNDPHIHGRETADRPELRLPAPMRAIWQTAVSTSSRAVLTLVSSYPYAVGAEAARAAAVVWSCHAGQELGHGLVDVLSGDRTPTGRLPQTWWENESDAGDILEYDVVTAGQTYRYNEARPLFGIGHGLGYSEVSYEAVELSTQSITAPTPSLHHAAARHGGAGEITARVSLRNAGERDVDELVALWAQAPDLPVPAPRLHLLAWTRVALAPGERDEVSLSFDPRQLAVWDVAATTDAPPLHTPGAFRVQPGSYRIASGPSAVDLPVGAELVVSGPALKPRMLRDNTLNASAFSAYDGIVTSDRTRAAGYCIEVAPSRGRGWARFDLLDATGVNRVRLSLARRALPAPGCASLTIEVSPAGSNPRSWLHVATTIMSPTARAADHQYEWQEVTLALETLPSGPLDLRVTLTGDARLAELEFLTGSEFA